MKFYSISINKLKILFVLIIITSSFHFAQVKGGRWTFENNGNDEATWDEFDNIGSLSGAASYQSNTPLAQGSYYLSVEDSADYGAITVADHDELDFLDENFAASLWVYPVKGYDEPQYFFMKGDRSGAVKENNYALRTKDEYVEFIVHSESGAKKIGRSSFKILENEWIFIAVFYDFNQSKLYLWNDPESAPIDTLDFNAPLFPNYVKLYIGTSGVDGYKRFWGRIDDLRISNNVADILDNTTSIEFSDNYLQPSKFLLNQNFPNPFNPATVIQYSIPVAALSEVEGQHVSLKVYNMLGREVFTLVNEHQRPGEYTINFDASSLSSGVYFYKLSAGHFSDSKKMILLK